MIKRSVFSDLIDHLQNREITMLVGPRQAGKTTLMVGLINELKIKGKQSLYLNLDNEKEKRFFVSQSSLVEKIKGVLGEEKGYVFIDEIQRKEDAGIFIKGIYDMELPYKFVITGSGSIELKEKVYESLAGRKRLFEIYPLSFEEFVNYKTEYKNENKLEDYLDVNKDERRDLLEEYLKFGGYPKIVLSETSEEKNITIEDIYKSFIEKDIQALLRVEKSDIFLDLLRVLASQNGRIINYTELSNTLKLSLPTLKKYLWYLEKTYILEKSSPFFRNVRKEITKSPIMYFIDFGFRNYALGSLGNYEMEKGFVFQNFIFNNLRDLLKHRNIRKDFWRTKQGGEVDIVLDAYPKPIPIEVKYSSLDKLSVSRSLRSFIEKYKPQRAFIVNLSLEERLKVGETQVEALPFFKLSKIIES
ncbi:ATPase [Candidatus Woesebacteria bacterium CG22_combo_CG10-13_8_21_14_all_39_10]|uniref:ATPase n=3 Tax=Candidatus Woeseibacteriota TaxID=1752722 RepID=A0A2M7AQG2_9BACT|nr:MAG: ATPase [Candidatus Woesebacteria bacterium CG22_combo_CG10-13_8_21_14_all_39_10]PIU71878.1 MAG: ATPase [Candidatus Woesebacteria bacterium CG06_land_8_20_14_3_00_39_27]PIZ49743.1 MAG: ATPase [Candidatus Woesebacteria bacterium CG_4_10_14_0_2_um_filter_39_14]